jgi:cytochrome c-type biogenesis protein CcmH/NrfF
MMDRLLREGNPPAGQLASPKPQYKDVQTNSWEELKGEGGASYVKDKDVFAKLEQARALLAAISGKDFATQTTLAAVLAKLADLESELATIKANQLSGNQKVQLSGTPFATLKDANGNVVSPATEDKLEQVRQLLTGVATEAKLEQARVLLNTISNKDFATQATLEVVQSELALIKSELANIKANQLSGDQKVQLSGTMTERYGADVNSRPPADTVPAGATFTIVDESGYFQTWISDGTKWVEV